MKIFNLRVIFNDEYVGLKAECERQSVIIDKTTAERNKEHKKVKELENVISTHEKAIATYKKEKTINKKEQAEKDLIIKKQAKLIEEKEAARRTNASKIGGYSKENHKLRDKIEELDSRIDELKANLEKQINLNKKLEETNEFLKTHRRAPDIEEIKDYTLHRRRKVKKAS